jgi:hypothetical protein
MRGQNGLVRVVVTRIDPDGTLHRRMVDTAQQSQRQLWEDLAARAVGGPVPYRPAPGIAVYHISVDDDVVIAAEHDLIGSLRELVTAVMALGGELLEQGVSPPVASSLPWDHLGRGDRGGDIRAALFLKETAKFIALAEASLAATSRCAPASIAYGPRRRVGYT